MSLPHAALTKALLLSLALAALAAGGCAAPCKGKLRPLNVNVALDPQMRDASGRYQRVEVDIVAVNASSLPEWENKAMSEYFTRSDPFRNSAEKYTIKLDEGHTSERLRVTDPAWEAWKKQGAMSLLILSSTPRAVPDAPGNRDPRRRIVSLDCADIPDEKVDELDVVVKPSGLSVGTPRRGAK